jgi:hypothetical protein
LQLQQFLVHTKEKFLKWMQPWSWQLILEWPYHRPSQSTNQYTRNCWKLQLVSFSLNDTGGSGTVHWAYGWTKAWLYTQSPVW